MNNEVREQMNRALNTVRKYSRGVKDARFKDFYEKYEGYRKAIDFIKENGSESIRESLEYLLNVEEVPQYYKALKVLTARILSFFNDNNGFETIETKNTYIPFN